MPLRAADRREATWRAGVDISPVERKGGRGPVPSSGDGNGWVRCSQGHRHWGRFGAAGLLLTDGVRVVLQHRSEWTHEGGTWALPGGARDSAEDAVAAALREAAEEADLDPTQVHPFERWIDDHGGWSYTTVLASADPEVRLRPSNFESTAIRWWDVSEVEALPLHRGFAATWPRLRDLLATGPR